MRVDSLRRSFLLFLLVAGLAGPSMATVAQAAEVTVFAAASLKNALDDAAKTYEAKTGDKVVLNYAASSGPGKAD
jgi:molybdate transport system substrate-binding protein